MIHDGRKTTRWLSVSTPLKGAWLFGLGVTWCKEDRSFCVIVEAGPLFVFIGPHYSERAIWAWPS